MKKLIIGLFFFFTFSGYCLDSYNQNLKDLKKEINEIFGIKEESSRKPIYLISVTRTSKDGHSSWILPNPIIKNVNEIEEVLRNVAAEINKFCSDGHKIIAFNEMFFSQQQALDFSHTSPTTVTHNTVMQCVKRFNTDIPNSIIFCNLLYKEDKTVSWQNALYLYALTLFREKNMCLNRDATILPKPISAYLWDEISKFNYVSSQAGINPQSIVNQYVISYPNKDTFSINDFYSNPSIKTIASATSTLNAKFLANRTYCIYQGMARFFYNKSSYYRENDISIKNGYIYDLGDGYPTFLDLLILDDVEKIFNTISTEICLDFVCGIRKNNNWKSKRDGVPSKLHIIQSNSVETWLSRQENYPFNIPVLYSDADYYFPNFRMAFGGITCCLQLQRDEQHSLETSGKRAVLYDKVYEIHLPKRSSSSNGNIDDYYNIWIYKI